MIVPLFESLLYQSACYQASTIVVVQSTNMRRPFVAISITVENDDEYLRTSCSDVGGVRAASLPRITICITPAR